MTSTCGLGFYPQNGQIITGRIDQTSRIERSGTYNAASGTVLGTRVVCHRLYAPKGANDQFDSVRNGNAWTSGTAEYLSMNSGHVVLWSCSGDGTTSATIAKNSGPFYLQISGGKWDQELQNTFAQIESLNWGGAVVPIPTTTGSKEVVPGSQYGGTKPTEMIWLQNHEPNINTGATRGTPAQFAGMMKHLAQLYDTYCTNHSIVTKHIKFAVCLSNPSGTTNVNSVAGNFYDVGNSNDISKTGVRPMDYAGWDIYYPRTENSGQGPVTASDEIGFSATSKYGACHAWTTAHMPAGCLDIIPEYANRIPTSPVSGGAGPDPTWPASFYTGMITYLNANLVSGSQPVKYMCQYAAESVLSNKVQGGADNSIIPDQTTQATSYEDGGVSLRPAFTAYHDALVTLGNPSLGAGNPGVQPTGVAAVTPPTGALNTTLSWTTNAANVSYNIYKDGVATQTGVTGGSTTVFATGTALPQTHTYQVSGIGTNGVETALSSPAVSVTFTATAGTPPPTPTGVAASNIQQTSATVSWNASAGATSYSVVVDGGSPITTTTTSLGLTGLSSGVSHSVTVAAANSAGTSAASGALPFTTTSAGDTTPPSVPTGLAANSVTTASASLSWTASTDTVVAGATTSGMGIYVVQRSLSPLVGTGTIISGTGQTSTSLLDSSPPSSSTGPTTVYYTVAAVDVAGNQSAFSAPLAVVIPQSVLPSGPTAVLSVPASVSVGQLFSADGSQSIPGTSGAIASWTFDFGDGVVVGPSTQAVVSHRYLAFGSFAVRMTATDAAGLTNIARATVVASPPAGLTLPFSGAPLMVPNANILAADVDTALLALDSGLGGHDLRLGINETNLAQIGNPVTPRRNNGAVFVSTSPDAAGAFLTLNATTMYVLRCVTAGGAPFSSVHWVQVAATPSAVTNSFWAVYDVTGALMSPATVTDVSASWATNAEQSFTLDGGPYDPPLGADNTDPGTALPTQEFFLAFWLGTVGATHPQIACGSTYANAVNIGTTSPLTPTQATIQQAPLFATAANGPSVALTPPATLGALTRLGASPLIALY